MTKPKLPPEFYCLKCRKSIGGKGWFGPGCMCDVRKGSDKLPHRIGVEMPR